MKGYASMSVVEFVKSAGIVRVGDKIGPRNIYKRDAKEFMDAAKARKSEIMEYLLAQEAEAKRAAEEREEKITSIKGLSEIRAAIADAERYHEEFDRMMEEGNGRLPKRPASDIRELKARYPRAAAYLKAESLMHAANYAKASAYRKAYERILNDDDYKLALEDADKEWNDYCANYCANVD